MTTLFMRTLWKSSLLAVATCVCAWLLAGCGASSSTHDSQVAAGPNTLAGALTWPPNLDAARVVSGTQQANGADFTEKSGNAAVNGTALNLAAGTAGEPLAWAYYTVAGILTDASVTGVVLNTTINPAPQAGTTVLYIGLANYTRGAWEWFAAEDGEFTHNASTTQDYISPAGSVSVAVALWESANPAAINSVSVNTTGGTLQAPANLSPTPGVGSVDLAWDAVSGASGYYVERDTNANFTTVVRVNSEPVTEPTYNDGPVTKKKIFFYRVLAAAGELESQPSETVSVFVPEVELAAPQNFRVSQATSDSLTFAWSWDGSSPGYFDLHVHDQPGQQLTIDFENLPGFLRSYRITGLSPNQTVYARLIAGNGGWNGHSTEEIPATTLREWEWGTPVDVGLGHGPMAACTNNGGIAVAYLSTSGITLGTCSGSAWSTQTIANGTDYGGYIGMNYSDADMYCVAVKNTDSDDLYCITGNTGTWNISHVHGDGNAGPGHAISGNEIDVAASSSEFAVTHFNITDSKWMLHRTGTSAVNWSGIDLVDPAIPSGCSISYVGGVLHAAYYDNAQSKLMHATSDDSWAFSSVLSASNDGVGLKVDMLEANGSFYAFGRKLSANELYSLSGLDAPWSATKIGKLDDLGFNFSSIQMMDTTPICGGFSTTDGWNFIFSKNGQWSANHIDVPGSTPGAAGAIISIGSTPYFIYEENGTGRIKCTAGIPPV